MKKILFAILGIGMMAEIAQTAPYVYDYNVAINSTTATVVVRPRIRRNYMLAVNVGSYDVNFATYAVTATDVNAKYLPKNYGYYEENYLCYQSTYYAISVGGATNLRITEKE